MDLANRKPSEAAKLLRDVNYSCQSTQGARKIEKDGETESARDR